MSAPVFVDPHGAFWSPCAAEAGGAEAFGPSGCARRVAWNGHATLSEAQAAGVAVLREPDEDGWDWVVWIVDGGGES